MKFLNHVINIYFFFKALIKKHQEELLSLKEELNKKTEELENKTRDLLSANEELAKTVGQLNEANAKEQCSHDELEKQKNMLEEVRDNYNRELLAHAACAQSVNELSDKNTQLTADLENLRVSIMYFILTFHIYFIINMDRIVFNKFLESITSI